MDSNIMGVVVSSVFVIKSLCCDGRTIGDLRGVATLLVTIAITTGLMLTPKFLAPSPLAFHAFWLIVYLSVCTNTAL